MWLKIVISTGVFILLTVSVAVFYLPIALAFSLGLAILNISIAAFCLMNRSLGQFSIGSGAPIPFEPA